MTDASRDGNFVPTALFQIDGEARGNLMSGQIDQATGRILVDVATASGTVTTVSVVSANGFAGTVATATTTPAITLTTTVTGVLKGNGTAISAAVANTDYQSPVTLTTTGSSGAATFNGTTLNIPDYSTGSGTVDTVVGTLDRITVNSTDPANPVVDIASTYVGQGTITTLGTITTGVWNGTDVPVSAGGTGLSTISALSLWVANSANTITEVTPGAGQSVRINAGNTAWEAYTPATGSVTSVAASVPTGLTISGSPVTTSGTLAIALDTGYVIPLQSTLNGFANTALSNLASVAINTSLVSDTTNTDDIGSAASLWRTGYFGTSIELGSATDTTLARIAAGRVSIEGVEIATSSNTLTLTNKTFDANGTGNSITNIDVADLANGTDGELITWSSTGTPTTVAVGTSGQVLTSNGTGAAPTFQDAAGGGADVQTFDASGTWTKPAGAMMCFVEVWGGGGSGGATSVSSFPNAVAGGAAGEYRSCLIPAGILGATETVTIGAGGAAAVTSNSQSNGSAGGNTTFAGIITANGGGAGLYASGSNTVSNSTGGTGGSTTYGAISNANGPAGGGVNAGTPAAGGNGVFNAGGGSGTSNNTSVGTAGTSDNAGAGGLGDWDSAVATGGTGGVGGGGGGGAYADGGDATSGAGGAGRVRVTTVLSA